MIQETAHGEQAIALRAGRWLRTGNPAHLWPDVSESALLAAHRAIWNATGALLRRESQVPPLDTAESGDPRTLGIAAFRAGMGALLGFWIERGQLVAAPAVVALLAEHLLHGRRRAAVLDAALVQVLAALDHWEIIPTLLKGAHTGHVHFAEAACRVGTDLDLLVDPIQLPAARGVLRSLGYREESRPRIPTRSAWYPGGSPTHPVSLELAHADNPWSVDLHCSLERRYFRGLSVSVDHTTLARRRLTIAGHTAMVLDDPHLIAHLALHGSRELGFPQVIRVVELIAVIRQASVSPRFWPETHAYLTAQQLYRFVAPMFVLAEEAVPGIVAVPVLHGCRAALTARWRRWLDYVLAHGLSRPHQRTLDERLVWAASWPDTVKIASDLVWHGDNLGWRDRLRLWSEGAQALLKRRAAPGPAHAAALAPISR